MTAYIYHVEGYAQGFTLGKYVYDLKGRAIGWVSADRVYRLDGLYVGELFKGMIVEKPVGVRTNLAPIVAPEAIPPPVGTGPRTTMSYGYPDVFHMLLEAADAARGPQDRVTELHDQH